MQITEQEKDELYAEFKDRMRKEKLGYASGYETLHNLEPAKDYFWSQYRKNISDYDFDIWSPKGIHSLDWDLIRKLVCHANGVCIVKDIPSEKIEEANQIAIKIIDMLFEYNRKILDEEKSQ